MENTMRLTEYKGGNVVCMRKECGHVGQPEFYGTYVCCAKCSTAKVRNADTTEIPHQ